MMARRAVSLMRPFHGQARAQIVPQVVILAQAVVQPADVDRVLYGIAGEAQGDDLVDRPAQPVQADVGETRRQVGPKLAPETVLRRQNEIGFMPLFAQGAHRLAGDCQVPAFDEGDIRSDDQDALLVQRLNAEFRRLFYFCWS